ncbi:substrate-binding domain-containing protein, partial [Oleiphilus sp. HI0067]
NGDVDFAVSDLAMSDEQLSYLEQGALMVPLIAGQVSLMYSLPSVSDLKLSRDVYSRIFLGEIQYWDHPDIQTSNPGIQLPATPISVVVRSDASGSSFLFSNHLALVSESFRNNVGASKLPEWSDQPYFLSALHNQGGHSFCASDRGCYWLC